MAPSRCFGTRGRVFRHWCVQPRLWSGLLHAWTIECPPSRSSGARDCVGKWLVVWVAPDGYLSLLWRSAPNNHAQMPGCMNAVSSSEVYGHVPTWLLHKRTALAPLTVSSMFCIQPRSPTHHLDALLDRRRDDSLSLLWCTRWSMYMLTSEDVVIVRTSTALPPLLWHTWLFLR